jgi:hypothetical protein
MHARAHKGFDKKPLTLIIGLEKRSVKKELEGDFFSHLNDLIYRMFFKFKNLG